MPTTTVTKVKIKENGAFEFTTERRSKAIVQINVEAFSGTTPTVKFILEDSVDGVNWNTVVAFTEVKGETKREVKRITPNEPIANYLRLSYTLGGTTPEYEVSVVEHS